MTMPAFDCPVCRNPLTWDVVFAHQGVREAMLALVNAHPDGSKLLRPLLAYIGLFAPHKTAMRYERIASLARELVGMIRTAQVERAGRSWPAPTEYWQRAMDDIVTRHHAGGIKTPLASHGYLFEIIAGYAGKAEAAAETRTEKQRAGHAGHGANPNRDGNVTSTTGLIRLDATLPKSEMPQHVREALNLKSKKSTTTEGEANGH